MKHTLLCCISVLLMSYTAHAWGFFGHKKINELAVLHLPKPLFGFYKSHIKYIKQHSVDPDKRRHAVVGEAAKHYIDLDEYGVAPFHHLPKYYKPAADSVGEEQLQKHGILPYNLYFMTFRLTKAFEAQDVNQIIKISADLGHYVGDAHVPLHTTKNYNGQLTNQTGIHGFWESRLPELFENGYDLRVPQPNYFHHLNDSIWSVVLKSHELVPTVLATHAELQLKFEPTKQYTTEDRGQTVIQTFSKPFANAYHEALNGMVEQRMRDAVYCLSSIWFTCWVNAGQPPLPYEEIEESLPTDTLTIAEITGGRRHEGDGF